MKEKLLRELDVHSEDEVLGARELEVLEEMEGVAGIPDEGGEFLGRGYKQNQGYVEQSLFRCYTCTIPHLFLHYIDDCVDAASCSHEELEQFNNFTNTFHPNFKFTWTISNTSLPFLDLSISISGESYHKIVEISAGNNAASSGENQCENHVLFFSSKCVIQCCLTEPRGEWLTCGKEAQLL
eukprot:g38113.t1